MAYIRPLALYCPNDVGGNVPGIWIREKEAWEAFPTQPPFSANDATHHLWGNPDTGLIVTHSKIQQKFFHYDVDTDSWSAYADGVGVAGTIMQSVFGIDDSNIWAVIGTKVVRWDGASWSVVLTDSGLPPSSHCHNRLWGSSAFDVWVPGGTPGASTGRLWHWNGSTWTDRFSEFSSSVGNGAPTMVWGKDSSSVWIAIDLESGSPCGYVVKYDGTSFAVMGVGLGKGRQLIWGREDGPDFTGQAGQVFASLYACGRCGSGSPDVIGWNGSLWFNTLGSFPSTTTQNPRGFIGLPDRNNKLYYCMGAQISEGGGGAYGYGQVWECDDSAHRWTRRNEMNTKAWFGFTLWDDCQTDPPDESRFYRLDFDDDDEGRSLHTISSLTHNWAKALVPKNPESDSNYLHCGLLVINERDIWVGSFSSTGGTIRIYHVTDGRTWTTYEVDLSSWGTGIWRIGGFHYVSSTEIYAVASYASSSGVNAQCLKWNGTAWARVGENHTNALSDNIWKVGGIGGEPEFLTVGDSIYSKIGVSKWAGEYFENESAGNGLPVNVRFSCGEKDGDGNWYILNFPPDESNTIKVYKGDIGSWSVLKSDTGRDWTGSPTHAAMYGMAVRGSGTNLEILYLEYVTATTVLNVVHFRDSSWTTVALGTAIGMPVGITVTKDFAQIMCDSATDNKGGWLYDLATQTATPILPASAYENKPGPLYYPQAILISAELAPITITPISPLDGEEGVSKNEAIRLKIESPDTGVSFSSVRIWVRGEFAFIGGNFSSGWTGEYFEISDGWEIILQPERVMYYDHLEVIGVRAYVEDESASPANESWSFTAGRDIGLKIYQMLFDGARKIDEERR